MPKCHSGDPGEASRLSFMVSQSAHFRASGCLPLKLPACTLPVCRAVTDRAAAASPSAAMEAAFKATPRMASVLSKLYILLSLGE